MSNYLSVIQEEFLEFRKHYPVVRKGHSHSVKCNGRTYPLAMVKYLRALGFKIKVLREGTS